MVDKSDKGPFSPIIEKIRPARGDIILLGGVVLFVAILFMLCGTWPAIVTIESESMVPHMNIGDLVLVIKGDRLGPIQSMSEGNQSGYQKFGMPGDVIIYRPNGVVNYPRNIVEPNGTQNLITNLSWNIRTLLTLNQVHPIIHRAITWVDEGELLEPNDPYKRIAPHSGYITKGDHNAVNDQVGFGNNYRGLGSSIGPVKPEWIIGKSVFTIPLVGY
ncbi:MAG TPA: S26 family signal peptidase, partial [Methanospirillum sp.]|nr:S26 family signal peptidase [Methanospirillum sp.]